MNDSNQNHGRRTFLKKAGVTAASLATIPVVGAATGPRSAHEIYMQSLDLCEKAGWDVHQWRRWLAHADIDFKYQDVAIHTPRGPNASSEKTFGEARTDNEPSSQKLDAHETWHYMTYTRLGDVDRFRFDWSLNDGWDDHAEPPVDWPGMSFDSFYYNFSNDYSPRMGPYVSNSSRGDSFGPSYRTFEYNEDGHAFYTSGRFESYFDVALYPESSDRYTRQIWTRFHHTWSSVDVSSIGVDTAGVVTVNFEDTTKRWFTTAFCEENEMDNGDSYVDQSPHTSG